MNAVRPRTRRAVIALAALAALSVLMACAGEITSPGEPLRLLAPSLPQAFEGEPFDATLRPTGGLRPYSYAVVDGALPPGLRLEGGRLLGNPTSQGRYAFTVEVRDANLNRTVQRLEMTVRPLPDPVVSIDLPPTELQRATELRLRLESGRGWRGAEVLITWDADAFDLRPDSVRPASRDRIAVWETGPGRLRVDVATLGEPLSSAADLLRFTLEPREPARLGLTITTVSVTAAGRTTDTRRLGAVVAPRVDPGARPPHAADERTDPSVGQAEPEPADPVDALQPDAWDPSDAENDEIDPAPPADDADDDEAW